MAATSALAATWPPPVQANLASERDALGQGFRPLCPPHPLSCRPQVAPMTLAPQAAPSSSSCQAPAVPPEMAEGPKGGSPPSDDSSLGEKATLHGGVASRIPEYSEPPLVNQVKDLYIEQKQK